MSVELIQDRLSEYRCTTEQEEENAIKEIVQEVCLAGLSRSGFFKQAVFQGGTCLRILYGLPRFSEDLDLALRKPNTSFEMGPHLHRLIEELKAYGFDFTLDDRSRADNAIKQAFLKDESWGTVLTLRHQRSAGAAPKKIRIKIEVDTRPPAEGSLEDRVLDFPFPFTVVSHDLPTLFAGKNHALLCRPYIKGRDWYDFLWYVRKGIKPDLAFLNAALRQAGPWAETWKDQEVELDLDRYKRMMSERITAIDWNEARRDVSRFVRPQELPSLDLWNATFFLERLGSV